MSDLMFYGVLRMPYELAMGNEISRLQFYGRAKEAADRIEAADVRIADLEAKLAAAEARTVPAQVGGALDAERAAFEKYKPDAIFSRAGAVYANSCIQVMWELWQAGSKYAYIEAIKIQNSSINICAQQAGAAQALAVPDGWKLVPVEPDDAQQLAGAKGMTIATTTINKMFTANRIYRDMVAAAPIIDASATPGYTPPDWCPECHARESTPDSASLAPSITDEGRAAGRAEAMQLLLSLDPETGIDDYTGWSHPVGPEDEGSAYWDKDKLSKLFHVGIELQDMMDQAESQYWQYMGANDDAERAKNFASNMLGSGEIRDALCKAGEHDLVARLCASPAAPPKQCWSANKEEFNHDSLGELIDANADDLKVGDTVWFADAVTPDTDRLYNTDDMFDQMNERAYDIAGEHTEDYPDVDQAATDELKSLLDGWIKKHAPPNFYEVKNVKSYVLTADDLA